MARRLGTPAAERRSDHGHRIHVGQVAGDDHRRLARIEDRRVPCRERRPVEPRDGRFVPGQQPGVRHARRIDRGREGALDPSTRLGCRLQQVVDALLAQPVDLVGRQRRVEEHLGHQVQGRAEVPARDLGRGDQRLPAGVGVDLGARAARSPRRRRSRRAPRCPRAGRAPASAVTPASSAGSTPAPPSRMSCAASSGRPARWALMMVRPLSSRSALERREVIRTWVAGAGTRGQVVEVAHIASTAASAIMPRRPRRRAARR